MSRSNRPVAGDPLAGPPHGKRSRTPANGIPSGKNAGNSSVDRVRLWDKFWVASRFGWHCIGSPGDRRHDGPFSNPRHEPEGMSRPPHTQRHDPGRRRMGPAGRGRPAAVAGRHLTRRHQWPDLAGGPRGTGRLRSSPVVVPVPDISRRVPSWIPRDPATFVGARCPGGIAAADRTGLNREGRGRLFFPCPLLDAAGTGGGPSRSLVSGSFPRHVEGSTCSTPTSRSAPSPSPLCGPGPAAGPNRIAQGDQPLSFAGPGCPSTLRPGGAHPGSRGPAKLGRVSQEPSARWVGGRGRKPRLRESSGRIQGALSASWPLSRKRQTRMRNGQPAHGRRTGPNRRAKAITVLSSTGTFPPTSVPKTCCHGGFPQDNYRLVP